MLPSREHFFKKKALCTECKFDFSRKDENNQRNVHIYYNTWMCIYSALINNHCQLVYHDSSQILIFHRLFCLLAFAYIYSSVHDGKGSSWGNMTIITRLIKTAWTDPCLVLGSGKWTACGSSHPALQQPPHLRFTSQYHASNCLWPSALAPSSAQQWTLKPAGRCEGDPTFITLMGGSLPHTGPCGIIPPSTYEQQFCFFIHVFLHVIHVHLPVAPAERSSLYMCALLLQSRRKKKKRSQSTAFVRILCNCFHFYKLLWRYNAYMYDKKKKDMHKM